MSALRGAGCTRRTARSANIAWSLHLNGSECTAYSLRGWLHLRSPHTSSPLEEWNMASDSPLTFNQAVRGITEFIEVAIHTILYVRQVYPAELFVRRKKYNTPVFQSRHPALNEYISGAIKAIGDELFLGNVDKVVVVIKNKEDVALERFIFATRNLIQVESYNKDTSVEGAISSASLGQYFRSFLIKLSMIEAQLGQLCLNDLSFAIILELQDDKVPTATNEKEPPPWIPAITQHTTSGASENAELHMIRAVDTGIINLSFAVQESEQKLMMERDMRKAEDPKGKQRAS
ncbi:Mitotic spindle assembly checkpoint protein MAD2B [Grifola frondosa]|uniref:Mitotic spindle assembly checkpoint protein MAD2B n=1 Tax=Grifola frondosa TaxID=5627 RepID=A0A1C7MPD0_GRIFR|nr:Mitotic spindle assembly checkpoint protein MAD2B [Grifola frondosa]